MNIAFLTPAAPLRTTPLYRLGNQIYTRPNAITGPLILGTLLQERGHSVSVYEELYARVDLRDLLSADVIALSTMTSTANRAYAAADFFRDHGKRVIIGGMHATVMPEETLRHADTVVVGEAERVIVDVVEHDPRGIVRAPVVDDLDTILFPDYSLLKTPCREANLMTTRGCQNRCSFCSTSRMFSPYRERSVGSVIAELAYYKKRGFKYVNFQDDNFTGNRERAKAILQQMIARDLVFKDVFFFGRADIVNDEELLTLLCRAHLRSVLIGFESINQASLDRIGKNIKLDSFIGNVRNLARHRIKLLASLVLGLDTDGSEDIRRAVRFFRNNDAFTLQPAVLTPFPGTPLYQEFERDGRMITKDWQYFD